MRANLEKITSQLVSNNILLFFPATLRESQFIQQQLFDMGYGWKNKGKTLDAGVDCVQDGICVNAGVLFTRPADNSIKKGLLCRSDQFETPFITPEMSFLMEQFETVNKRLSAIEEQLSPHTLAKKTLKVSPP